MPFFPSQSKSKESKTMADTDIFEDYCGYYGTPDIYPQPEDEYPDFETDFPVHFPNGRTTQEEEDYGGDFWDHDPFFCFAMINIYHPSNEDQEFQAWDKSQETQKLFEETDEETFMKIETAPLRHHRKRYGRHWC